MNSFKARLVIALAALGAVSASCATTSAGRDYSMVSIEPGSKAGHVVFQVASSAYVFGFSVTSCGGKSVMWVIGTPGTKTPLSSITYGEAPAGYVVHAGPRPLSPGCYEAKISGSKETRFLVEGSGAVREER